MRPASKGRPPTLVFFWYRETYFGEGGRINKVRGHVSPRCLTMVIATWVLEEVTEGQEAATRGRKDYKQLTKNVEPRRPEGSETPDQKAAKDHKEVTR